MLDLFVNAYGDRYASLATLSIAFFVYWHAWRITKGLPPPPWRTIVLVVVGAFLLIQTNMRWNSSAMGVLLGLAGYSFTRWLKTDIAGRPIATVWSIVISAILAIFAGMTFFMSFTSFVAMNQYQYRPIMMAAACTTMIAVMTTILYGLTRTIPGFRDLEPPR